VLEGMHSIFEDAMEKLCLKEDLADKQIVSFQKDIDGLRLASTSRRPSRVDKLHKYHAVSQTSIILHVPMENLFLHSHQ
jgi:hypothetical protein